MVVVVIAVSGPSALSSFNRPIVERTSEPEETRFARRMARGHIAAQQEFAQQAIDPTKFISWVMTDTEYLESNLNVGDKVKLRMERA